MKKLLWCGGSHLANAKNVICEQYQEFDNHFLPTAGPLLQRWGLNGGEYRIDRCKQIISREKIGCLSEVCVDLSAFDRIIFVGQWIVPRRLFQPKVPLSLSLLRNICNSENFFQLKSFAPNVPLQLFPELTSPACKTILLPDPYPVEKYTYASGHFWEIPEHVLDYFYDCVNNACMSLGVEIIEHPISTLCKKYAADNKFVRPTRDGRVDHHLSDEFWRIYISDSKDLIS